MLLLAALSSPIGGDRGAAPRPLLSPETRSGVRISLGHLARQARCGSEKKNDFQKQSHNGWNTGTQGLVQLPAGEKYSIQLGARH